MRIQCRFYRADFFRRLGLILTTVFSLQSMLALNSTVANANVCLTGPVTSLNCGEIADPGTAPPSRHLHRHVGNPIDVITGAKQQREIDFQAVGSALHFSRYYHSALSNLNSGLGHGWRHSYQIKLYAVDDHRIRIQQADGRWIEFNLVASQVEAEIPAQNDALSEQMVFMADQLSDGYVVSSAQPVWYLPDGRSLRFTGSFLTQIEYSNGQQLKLHYRQMRLESVTDNQSQTLVFEYADSEKRLLEYGADHPHIFPGYLAQLKLPSGRRIAFQYDEYKNLETVGYPDLNSKVYAYQNSDFNHHLTSIVDWDSQAYAARTWTYDSKGRVVKFDSSQTRHSLSLKYHEPTESVAHGFTEVEFNSGRQQRYIWQASSPIAAAAVIEVVSQDCMACKVVSEKLSNPLLHETTSVSLDAKLPARPGSAEAQQSRVVSSAASSNTNQVSQNPFPEAHQFIPVPDSLNRRTQITLSGTTHSFLIELTRLGEVIDIRVGGASLFDLKQKWADGKIERCDAYALFQRSQQTPNPDKGCLEDLIFLVELARHIEALQLSRAGDKNQFDRRKANKHSPSSYCLINPFSSCAELEREFELAQLSACAYLEFTMSCGSRWQSVAPASLGLMNEAFNEESFASTLFFNAQTNEYVLAFRGTDNLGDWKDNLLQASGNSSEQYEAAVALSQLLDRELAGATLSFTGHSLGGGLASAAALAINAQATVFNPAALHPETASDLGLNYSLSQSLIDVTTVDGDLLTAIQEPKPGQKIERFVAPGDHTVIAAPNDAWIAQQKAQYTLLARFNGIVLHSIDAVLETTETLLVALCGTTPERA